MGKDEMDKYTELTSESNTPKDQGVTENLDVTDVNNITDDTQSKKATFNLKIYVALPIILVVICIVLILCFSNFSDESEAGASDTTTKETVIDSKEMTELTVTLPNFTQVTTVTEPAIITEQKQGYYGSDRPTWGKNVVGELYIPGTYVNDLVAHCDNNTYYIDYNVNDELDNSGALFLDYRNDVNEFDRNNVIYGHNMKNGTRFGTLTRLLSEDYYTLNGNTIYYNTIDYDTKFKIFSVYEIDLVTFNYIQTGFDSDDDFSTFLQYIEIFNQINAVSSECFNVTPESKILTLSTCTQGGTHRLVVHAYLSDIRPAQLGD